MLRLLLVLSCVLALAPESAAQVLRQVLEASDPTGHNEFAAELVADGPDRMLVASRQANGAANRTGAVYLFERDASGVWQRTGKLFAPDGHTQHYFEVVALDGDDLLVGAWADNEAGGVQAGAVYAYERIAGAWVLQQKLLNPTPGNFGGHFARQIEVHDGHAFVSHIDDFGQPLVRIYAKQAGGWIPLQTWAPPGMGFSYGWATSFIGDGPGRVLVGNSNWTEPATLKRMGRVFVLEEAGGVWSLVDEFGPKGTPGHGAFGATLALAGDHLLVGATTDAGGLGALSGAFYHFVKDDQGRWIQRQKHKAPDGASRFFFGRSLDIVGDRAVVTSTYTSAVGSAYLYALRAGRFELQTRLDVEGTTDNGWYGLSSAIAGDEVLVGARVHWQFTGDGRAYAYDWPAEVEAFGQCGGLTPIGTQASFAALPPCGNAYAFGGCVNSTSQGGVLLAGGTTSVSADDLRLIGDQLPAGQLAALSMAAERRISPGGDGLDLLAGGAGSVYQFGPAGIDGAGQVAFGPGLVAESSAFGSGAILAGATWAFQIQYSDPGGPCGTGVNQTSALAVTFVP